MKTTIFRGLVIWMLAAAPLFTSCSKDNNNEQEQQKEQQKEQGEGEQEQKYDNLKVSVDKTLKVGLGDTATFTIEAGSGEYTVTSANEKVAKATLSEKTVSIQALTIGETEVIITDTKSKQTAKLTITVMANSHNIAPNEPYYIRLTTKKAIGETIRLGIDTETKDFSEIWIDFNNNGKRDSEEAVVGNGYFSKHPYELGTQYITIYGKVTHLNCEENLITSLDISNNVNLRALNCNSNNLTSLDISNNRKLERLDCSANNLTALDISNNVNLGYLDCSANNLTALDISKNVKLKDLDCSSNNLTSLDVSKHVNLEWLNCSSNKLTSLNIADKVDTTFPFAKIMDLDCSSNNLTSLYLGKDRYYTHLNIYKNKLDKTNMEKIIESLTDENYSDYPKFLRGWYDKDEANYKSNELKKLLKDKKYTVFVYNTSTKRWEEWR